MKQAPFFFLLLGLLIAKQDLTAQFYDQALGLRGGTTIGASYRRFIFYTPDIQQSIEGIVGFQFDERNRPQKVNGYVLEALYFAHIDVGFDTGFGAFAGAGLFGGMYTEQGQKAKFGGGITASIGMEYTFTHIPINISIDWKPFLGYPRMSLLSGGLSLRYVLFRDWQ
jgi:hypothetical protein